MDWGFKDNGGSFCRSLAPPPALFRPYPLILLSNGHPTTDSPLSTSLSPGFLPGHPRPGAASAHSLTRGLQRRGQLYGVGDGLQGIYASADGGDNRTKQWEGIRLFINPFDSAFYRIEWHNLLYRSEDEGASWDFLPGLGNTKIGSAAAAAMRTACATVWATTVFSSIARPTRCKSPPVLSTMLHRRPDGPCRRRIRLRPWTLPSNPLAP